MCWSPTGSPLIRVMAAVAAYLCPHAAALACDLPTKERLNRLSEFAATCEVMSSGFEAGSAVWVRVGGRLFFDGQVSQGLRGVNVVALQDDRVLLERTYDTEASKAQADDLAEAIEKLPDGTFVVVAVCDDGTRSFTERAQRAIRSVGGRTGLFGQPLRSSYYCIGMKGLQVGQAIEKLGAGRLCFPLPFRFGIATEGRPGRTPLVTVTVKACDVAGKPVAHARVYAFSRQSLLFVPDLDRPACETDMNGIGVFCALRGNWTFFAVNDMVRGQTCRGWAVCTRDVDLAATTKEVTLSSQRVTRLSCFGVSKASIADGRVLAAPPEWAPSWRPVDVCAFAEQTTELETELDPNLTVWLHASGRHPAAAYYFLKTALSGERQQARWDATTRANGAIQVVVPASLPAGVQGHLFVEPLEFCTRSVGPACRLGNEDSTLLVSPGEMSARLHWEWGGASQGRFHAEFCNENFNLQAGKTHEVRAEFRLRAAPVIDRVNDTHLECWFDAIDPSGHRLDWLAAPNNAPFASLELLDDQGKLRHSFVVAHADQNWNLPTGQTLPGNGTYRFQCDLGPLGTFNAEGKIPSERLGIACQMPREHVTLHYPKASNTQSQAVLDAHAAACADGMERLLVEAYRWYGLAAPKGIRCEVPPAPPTAGGSAGRLIIFHQRFMHQWDRRRPNAWAVPAHELGHSIHCIEPLHPFFDETDGDTLGLYNESQATFMGNMGTLAILGRWAREQQVLDYAPAVFRSLKGVQGSGIGDPKGHLWYLSCYLHNQLGDEFARRCFRLALMDPPRVRSRIRAQEWSCAEKVCALYSAAADRDLGPIFRGLRFQVRDEVGPQAMKIAKAKWEGAAPELRE